MKPDRRALAELARLWGVQQSYRDVADRAVRAGSEAILATLAALGAPVEGMDDVPAAIRARRAAAARRLVEPVVVAWDGRLVLSLLGTVDGPVTVDLQAEDGTATSWRLQARAGRVAIPGRLPLGYHRLHLSAGRRRGQVTVIAAPDRASRAQGAWGIFLPLYSLHSRRSWGIGDLGDLGDMARWAGGMGAEVVSTTPLDAAFLDEPFEPGPYSPASRMFWNEVYLDLDRVPEVAALAPAGLEACRREAWTLRRGSLVDYRRAMALKRRALEAALGPFMAEPSSRRDAFLAHLERHPRLRDYALFRAATEGNGGPWSTWPRGQREGRIREADVDPAAYRYHLFAQWLVYEQLAAVHRDLAGRGVGLGLDLPVGCHPDGYDVWRERGRFALGASTGAPPDAFFSGGQDWGFPPPHPDGIREDGYAYLRACLQHVLSRARVLRVDHIMGFHRLYWIAGGADARHGVYVRYRPYEMYAVVLLEAHRAGATVIGEDLGTVPATVRRAMDRHAVGRSYVLQTELNEGNGLRPPPVGAGASLNTHDMPTFATFRRGGDIDLRVQRGWLDPAAAPAARRRRRQRIALLRRALDRAGHRGGLAAAALTGMAAGDAGLVLVGLEDVWEETEPQNVPGTTEEANWRRRTRYPLERFTALPRVTGVLGAVDRARRAAVRSPRS
jgi:4-alpha-glucanotransferase